MKTKITLSVILLLGVMVFISMGKTQIITGPHGGNVKPVENFNIETKVGYPGLYVYLLNKNCDPINNNGISCEVRFFFPDSSTIDTPLMPYEKDGFKIESILSGYHSYRVSFHVSGKIISARFDSENIIARKN